MESPVSQRPDRRLIAELSQTHDQLTNAVAVARRRVVYGILAELLSLADVTTMAHLSASRENAGLSPADPSDVFRQSRDQRTPVDDVRREARLLREQITASSSSVPAALTLLAMWEEKVDMRIRADGFEEALRVIGARMVELRHLEAAVTRAAAAPHPHH